MATTGQATVDRGPEPEVTILDRAAAHFARAEAAALLERWAEAIDGYDTAIAARAAYPEAWNRRGTALAALSEHDDALASYDQAIQLRPDYADAHNNRGIALRMLNRADEAIAAADLALAHDPASCSAFTTRANALRALGRLDEALADYDRAIEVFPANVSAHFNRALCRLQAGDFENGWPEYEWRWRMPLHQKQARIFEQPLWLGQESLPGRTILLHAEQGFGDTLQFCRYAPHLASLGAAVVLAAAPSLHGLLTTLAGVSLVVSRADVTPQFDMQCPLLSLPLALRTRLETIPAAVPYLAAPLPQREKWRARLGPRAAPRIGLAWAGNPEHGNDHNRSMPLELAASVVPPGTRLFCLQPDLRPRDIPALAMLPNVTYFGSELADFSDTAALMAEMDLVISVDTAVLHLAGALGLPAWGMLPLASDWRWLAGREDTPWYPSMRLFRQQTLGDWDPVLARIRREVQRWQPTAGARPARHSAASHARAASA